MSRANAKTRVKKKSKNRIAQSSLVNYFERFDSKKSLRLDLGVESS